MGLAEGVSTGDESNSLLVIHTHAVESHADIESRIGGDRVAVGSLGVDIDQTHVGGSERLLEVLSALTNISAAVVADIITLRDEGGLGTPVDALIRLPGVGTTTSKAKGLEVHGLESHVAGEKHKVSPRDLVAILLLDGPWRERSAFGNFGNGFEVKTRVELTKQATSLVKVLVIGPAVEGRETLLALFPVSR